MSDKDILTLSIFAALTMLNGLTWLRMTIKFVKSDGFWGFWIIASLAFGVTIWVALSGIQAIQ